MLIGSIALFSCTYFIAEGQMLIGNSDMKWHAEKAATLPFFDELLKLVPYPMFHFLVKSVIKVTSWEPAVVAPALLGFINVAAYVLTYYFMTENKTKKYSKNIYAVMTMVFLLLQSIYVPAFNPNVYLGQGSVNIWHNPTYIMVRPFGIAAFLLVIKMLRIPEGERVAFRKLWWMLLVVMIGCNLAKPSFSQVFIPGLGMYMVFDIVEHLLFFKNALHKENYNIQKENPFFGIFRLHVRLFRRPFCCLYRRITVWAMKSALSG